MEKKTLTFRADNQILVGQNAPARFASDTVSYIEAVFDLGENWSGFDAVKAIWSTDFDSICTVLDSSGACVVPYEVLERVGDVWVNLVGSISEDETLTDRLTTYPVKAVVVDANAAVCGSETAPITPSQFDQFAAAVRADADRAEEGATAAAASASSAAASATSASGSASSASQSASGAAQSAQSASESAESASESAQSASESASNAEEAKDTILNMTATATTLPEGSDATVDYSNGVMAFGIPRGDTGARGAKGDTGETGATPQMSIGTVETLAPDEDATATITGTSENPVLNLGLPKGETGDASKAELASLMPLETVSGSVASFSDGSAVFDAEQALVTLEPIQSGSGTPSPDNVRPISGHDSASVVVAGRNLLENQLTSQVVNGTTFTRNEDGSITISGKPSAQTRLYLHRDVFWSGTESAVISFGTMPNGTRCFAQKVNDGSSSYPTLSPSVNLSAGGEYRNLILEINTSFDGGVFTIYPQLELGSTATDYVPYVPTETYTAQFPSTVYGGTVDLVSGVLTVDKIYFSPTSVKSVSRANNRWYWAFQNPQLAPSDNNADLISSHFVTYSAVVEGNCYVTGNGSLTVCVPVDQSLNTAQLANAWLAENTLQFCYLLATPQTYQLTPQAIALLTGDNNVWSDGGQIQVKYRANIGLYVDKKISEVSQ